MTQIETIGTILMLLVFIGLGVVGAIIASQKNHSEHGHS